MAGRGRPAGLRGAPDYQPNDLEREILVLLAMGLNPAEAAAALFLSASAVTMRLQRLALRTGCHTNYQLMLLVGQQGWAPPVRPFGPAAGPADGRC